MQQLFRVDRIKAIKAELRYKIIIIIAVSSKE